MQHAVGSPLPPPHRPGHGPADGWSPAAHHPGAHPLGAHPPGAHQGPAPVPGPPPAPGYPGPTPQPTGVPQSPHPPPDTTGQVPLPPGGPVAMPSVPQAPAAADPARTTLAVLLIGPAGAGKTSVAKYWAGHRRVPTAHISLDDVREWVRSGFADPQTGWNDHSEAQYRLARRTCGFAARNFLANGISCILDDAVFPDRPVVGLGGWKRHVGPGLLPV
ncbi:Pro-rich N-terminal domain-containing protein, partial [Streptomyces hirsutus]